MASGHVNRIYRPNTWLHRPILQNVKKALANWRSYLVMSVHRGEAEIICSFRVFRLLTGGLNRSTQHFILEGKDGV
jgi:hypothetical protein